MRVFVDLDTQQLIATPGLNQEVTTLNFKRSPYANIEVQFTRRGTVIELANDATGIWGVKPAGKYDADYVTAAPAWVKTGSGETTVYTFIFTFITAPLNTLFAVDGTDTNDVATLTLMGELQWSSGGATLKTPTIDIVVANDINRGDEIVPSLPPVMYGVYLPSITGLTGGTPTDLDSIPTVGLLSGTIVQVLIEAGGELQWLAYVLTEGLAAGAGVIEPLDYDEDDNDRRWRGAIGPQGPQGPPVVWRTDSGVPDNGLGLDGDFYIDTDNSDVYKRVAGAYVLQLNIKGAPGVDGDDGEGVPVEGVTGQILRKVSDDDFDTEWVTPPLAPIGNELTTQSSSSTDGSFDSVASDEIGTASSWTRMPANGAKILGKWGFTVEGHATATRAFQLAVGNLELYTSPAFIFAVDGFVELELLMVRTGAATARIIVKLTASDGQVDVFVGIVDGAVGDPSSWTWVDSVVMDVQVAAAATGAAAADIQLLTGFLAATGS